MECDRASKEQTEQTRIFTTAVGSTVQPFCVLPDESVRKAES